ncbi:MAG: PorT family protein [Dysgonamonadaceae bacterium]|jgi:opacity protein-like surface antigen|nr:PorT family protein [Dysgonamonadaceae bacterium]
MKKIFLTLILCGFVGAIFAQGVKFGVTTGLNVSNESIKLIKTDWKAGFQGGVFLDYAVTPQLSLVPELLFTQRGSKLNISITDDNGKMIDSGYSETLNYLQLPVNVAYKFDLSNDQKLFPFAGAYLGYGLSGSVKFQRAGVESGNTKIKFGSAEDRMKRLDYGLNIGAGYQYDHIIFKLQYNHGLADLSNIKDRKIKNKNLAVTVGYLF